MDKNQNSITKRVHYYDKSKMSLYDFMVDSQYSGSEQEDNYTGKIDIEPELLKQLTEKFNALYISRRRGYLLQSPSLVTLNKAFIHKNKPLTDSVLQEHLLGKHTIACYPCNSSKTKWFLFDVDFSGKKALALAKRYTKRLIHTLKRYIPESFLHCYRSGSKGYHVVVYLDGPYQRDSIQQFQELIIRLAKLDQLENGKIEIRPQITDTNSLGQTAKMPLGRNFLNEEHGSNYCCFVSLDTLDYKPAPYKYVLGIEQLSRDRFTEIVSVVRKRAKEKGLHTPKRPVSSAPTIRNNMDQNNIIDFCNSYQITAQGQRHNITFEMAIRLKTMYQVSEKVARKALLAWLATQEGNYGSSKEVAIKDTEFQVKYVYSRGYEYWGRLVESVILTEQDIVFISNIANESRLIGPMERNAMAILVAMVRHAKLFITTEFYMSYNQISQLTGVRRNAINPCLRRLESLGKIDVVDRVDHSKGIPHANTYRLKYDFKVDDTDGYELHHGMKINVLEILDHFYSKI